MFTFGTMCGKFQPSCTQFCLRWYILGPRRPLRVQNISLTLTYPIFSSLKLLPACSLPECFRVSFNLILHYFGWMRLNLSNSTAHPPPTYLYYFGRLIICKGQNKFLKQNMYLHKSEGIIFTRRLVKNRFSFI